MKLRLPLTLIPQVLLAGVLGLTGCFPDPSWMTPGTTAIPSYVPTEQIIPDCIPGLEPVEAKVLTVIDGDTIKVSIDRREVTVRYLGLDTPEMDASDPNPGRLAKRRNLELVGNQWVTLYRGDQDKDDFGRLLRFVFIDDVFVNSELISQGLATSFNRPHDSACADLFNEDMLNAYESRLGIWEKADDEYSPGDEQCPKGCLTHLPTCDIKGNITSQDDYIYHLPSSPDYRDVKIQPDKGERWFCTVHEAIYNGWRPARQE